MRKTILGSALCYLILLLALAALLLTSGSFWALTALGGLAQAGIYFFYYRTLKRMEVWLVKLYLLLMPILCCFIGILFLGEHLSAGKLVGIGVVLLGASVILLREKINPTAAGENQPRP